MRLNLVSNQYAGDTGKGRLCAKFAPLTKIIEIEK